MAKKKTGTVTDIHAASGAKRTPWNGNVLDKKMRRPGGLLLGALMSHAAERGETLQELAKHLDVTYGYVGQLRSGLRTVNTISSEFARHSAQYLGVSVTRVMLMSGRLTPADFYASQDTFSQSLTAAMGHICRDPRWGHLITPALRSADQATQYVFVRLYQGATGTVLMPQREEPDGMSERLAA